MRLFDNLLADIPDEQYQPEGSLNEHPEYAGPVNCPDTEMLDFSLFMDTWQTNPMLSSVLDMSLGTTTTNAPVMGQSEMMGLYPDTMGQSQFM